MHPPPGPVVATGHGAHADIPDIPGEILGEFVRQTQHLALIFARLEVDGHPVLRGRERIGDVETPQARRLRDGVSDLPVGQGERPQAGQSADAGAGDDRVLPARGHAVGGADVREDGVDKHIHLAARHADVLPAVIHVAGINHDHVHGRQGAGADRGVELPRQVERTVPVLAVEQDEQRGILAGLGRVHPVPHAVHDVLVRAGALRRRGPPVSQRHGALHEGGVHDAPDVALIEATIGHRGATDLHAAGGRTPRRGLIVVPGGDGVTGAPVRRHAQGQRPQIRALEAAHLRTGDIVMIEDTVGPHEHSCGPRAFHHPGVQTHVRIALGILRDDGIGLRESRDRHVPALAGGLFPTDAQRLRPGLLDGAGYPRSAQIRGGEGHRRQLAVGATETVHPLLRLPQRWHLKITLAFTIMSNVAAERATPAVNPLCWRNRHGWWCAGECLPVEKQIVSLVQRFHAGNINRRPGI